MDVSVTHQPTTLTQHQRLREKQTLSATAQRSYRLRGPDRLDQVTPGWM